MMIKKIQGSMAKLKIEKSYQPSWDKLTNWSKRCYLSVDKPGTEVVKPSSDFQNNLLMNPQNDEKFIGLKFCGDQSDYKQLSGCI